MYEWIKGAPPLLLRMQDLEIWPGNSPLLGATPLAAEPRSFVSISDFEGFSVLAILTEALTTVVPLELGGLLLVSASYCDDDASVAEHLDVVPISGWQVIAKRFVSVGEEYVLFDGSRRGLDMTDPEQEAEIVSSTGGIVSIELTPGVYEVETLGPWRPDDRTELFLTRIVRESLSSVTALGPILP